MVAEAERLSSCLDETERLRGSDAQLRDLLASVDRALDAWREYKIAQRRRDQEVSS